MHTAIKTVLALLAPAAGLVALAACGGGQGPTVTIPTAPTEPAGPTVLPPARAETAGQSPVMRFGDELRVGVVAPPAGLAAAGSHGPASVAGTR